MSYYLVCLVSFETVGMDETQPVSVIFSDLK